MKLRIFKTKDEICIDKNKKCHFEEYNYKKYFPFLLKSHCHIHKNKIHMLHHKLFCFLFCKNYKFMINKTKQKIILKKNYFKSA
jgi:hypothetical protein